MLKVSVIIPTYNSWSTLKQCIKSIQSQSITVYEIIVIDNASEDHTAESISKYFPRVKVIKHKQNLGVTGGRNSGIKAASKNIDYLLFFDHDMVAEKNMLQQLIDVAEKDKDIGIVTPKIYYFADKKRIWSAGTGINLWTGQIYFRGGKDKGQYNNVEEVQVAPAALFVKKIVIEKLKGFDERYFATYEDTDFCFKARREGFKIFYAPLAIAFHIIPDDPKEEAERLLNRLYWVGRNRMIFMKDYGKNFFIFSLFIPFFVLYYFSLAVKYRRITSWFEFVKGTIKGMFV